MYVRILDPSDTTRVLAAYALVPRGSSHAADAGYVTLHTPLTRTAVFSGVHISLLRELGVLSAVAGVCDVPYIRDSIAHEQAVRGDVLDCGTSQSPVTERIMSLRPDGVVLSPMDAGDGGATLASLGLPVVLAADYLEPTPLGRAEWIRFFGMLYGCQDKADSIFDSVEHKYEDLRHNAKQMAHHPVVIMDKIYGDTWTVPTGASVTGQLIEDAGGVNPFASLSEAGGATLSPERVLADGRDADIWLVRYNDTDTLTLAALKDEHPIYAAFRPWRTQMVYGAHTMHTAIFDDGPFHPERILEEMQKIITGNHDRELKYYHRLK